MSSSTFHRFERRAADYVAGRPAYPEALIDHVLRRLALAPGAEVADIGSGTGIFTRALLARGLNVVAVEPGEAMRRAAEDALGGVSGFVSQNGTAATTGLAAASVSAIFCAQAFHWFNDEATRREWRRILRPGGSAVLVWNYADPACPFVAAYLDFIRAFSADGPRIMTEAWNAHHDNVLFRESAAETAWFPYEQDLDFAALLHRVGSTSYLPNRDDARFNDMTARLREIFDGYQRGGRVRFAYRSVAVSGPLG